MGMDVSLDSQLNTTTPLVDVMSRTSLGHRDGLLFPQRLKVQVLPVLCFQV